MKIAFLLIEISALKYIVKESCECSLVQKLSPNNSALEKDKFHIWLYLSLIGLKMFQHYATDIFFIHKANLLTVFCRLKLLQGFVRFEIFQGIWFIDK